MTTNSKSGELFLFSSDRRFIIKTLSNKELLSLSERALGIEKMAGLDKNEGFSSLR